MSSALFACCFLVRALSNQASPPSFGVTFGNKHLDKQKMLAPSVSRSGHTYPYSFWNLPQIIISMKVHHPWPVYGIEMRP